MEIALIPLILILVLGLPTIGILSLATERALRTSMNGLSLIAASVFSAFMLVSLTAYALLKDKPDAIGKLLPLLFFVSIAVLIFRIIRNRRTS